MTDTLTLTGIVGTTPRHVTTGTGLAIVSFRLASTQRRFDRTQNKWVDGDTNWYTVSAFRQLAANVLVSVNKGERVVVTGRLRIRDWTAGEKSGLNIDVEADAIGHDLAWGTASWVRGSSTSAGQSDPAEPSPAEFPTSEATTADSSSRGTLPPMVTDASEDESVSDDELSVPF